MKFFKPIRRNPKKALRRALTIHPPHHLQQKDEEACEGTGGDAQDDEGLDNEGTGGDAQDDEGLDNEGTGGDAQDDEDAFDEGTDEEHEEISHGNAVMTRAQTANVRTPKAMVNKTIERLVTMNLYQYLVTTRSAITSKQVKTVFVTLNRMATFIVWTYLRAYPDVGIFSNCHALAAWLRELITRHYYLVAEYCSYFVETLKCAAATVYNHLLDIKELRVWFCKFYSNKRVKSSRFRKICEIQYKNYAARKKREGKHRTSFAQLVKERKLPAGVDLADLLVTCQNAVSLEVKKFGKVFMNDVENGIEGTMTISDNNMLYYHFKFDCFVFISHQNKVLAVYENVLLFDVLLCNARTCRRNRSIDLRSWEGHGEGWIRWPRAFQD
jgi:hypothetical protein